MEEFDIYRRKTMKYCSSCLNTEDTTQLLTMNNYGWIFTNLFTNLYLTEQLHDSWICSWCVRRLENARKLMQNFQRAQILLTKIADSLYSCSLSQEIAVALSSEIIELKKKSRLHVSYSLENSVIKSVYGEKFEIEIKTEAPDDIVSDNEVGLNFDDGFEMELDHNITDSNGSRHRSTRSRINYLEKVKSSPKRKSKCKKSKSFINKENDEESYKGKNIRKKEKKLKVKNSSVPTEEITDDSMKYESTDNHARGQNSNSHNISSEVKLVVEVNESSNKREDCKVSKNTSKLKHVKKNTKARPYLPHLPRLACSECDQLFIRKIALENHMLRDHKKKFRCELCDKKFTREEYLKTHTARQHEPKSGIFECDICGIIYKHRVKIVAHMIKHDKYGPSLKDIEKIVCHHCGKICDRNHISNHLLTHSETKGYPCTYCDASFKVAQILENHVKRKHLDPDIGRTFLCPQCPKKFYTSTEVKYHVKAAHLLQSHPCPHCTKSFPIKGNLRAHILRVHEKVPALRDKKCDLCDKAFSTRRHLRHHRYTHTGEKPYKCDLCTSAYNQKYCLTLHKRRTHNIDKPKTVVKDFSNPTVSDIPLGEEFSNNVGNWYA